MHSHLQLGNEQYLFALKKCCILYISPRGSICCVCCDYKVTTSVRVQGSSENILRKKWACLVEVRVQASWEYSERCCCSLQNHITDVASPKWTTWGISGGVCFERKKLIYVYSIPERIENSPLDYSLYFKNLHTKTAVNSFPLIFSQSATKGKHKHLFHKARFTTDSLGCSIFIIHSNPKV